MEVETSRYRVLVSQTDLRDFGREVSAIYSTCSQPTTIRKLNYRRRVSSTWWDLRTKKKNKQKRRREMKRNENKKVNERMINKKLKKLGDVSAIRKYLKGQNLGAHTYHIFVLRQTKENLRRPRFPETVNHYHQRSMNSEWYRHDVIPFMKHNRRRRKTLILNKRRTRRPRLDPSILRHALRFL